MKAIHRITRAAVAVVGFGLLSSCDSFFHARGRVVECGTTTPVAQATIAVRVDRGTDGRQRIVTEASFGTAQDGTFNVTINEHSPSWVTLTFQKEGFNPLETQVKGAQSSLALCMTRIPSP